MVEDWDTIEPDLRRICASFIAHYKSDVDLDDLMQDTWLLADAYYDPERGDPMPFCTTIARNLVMDGNRHRRYHREYVADTKREVLLSSQGRSLESLSLGPMMLDERWDYLQAIMMKTESFEAQLLKFMYEYVVRYDEIPPLRVIASDLGCSHETVRQTLNRIVAQVERMQKDNIIEWPKERLVQQTN